jgi:hypothetical protein
MKALVLILIALILMANMAYPFDGRRTGIVVGAGAGLMYNADWSVKCGGGYYGSGGTGGGYQLLLGYGIHRLNVVAYECNFTSYSSDWFVEHASQGFHGVSWYHYFAGGNKSFVTTVGFGSYYLNLSGSKTTWDGPSMLFGIIYQFAPHAQIGVYRVEEKIFGGGRGHENKHFTLMLSILAY